MVKKELICRELVRKVPAGNFSWIDQRIVREGYVAQCNLSALALYLVLVVVGDSQGLSYYSQQSLGRLLHLDEPALILARGVLVKAGLIAYRKPLYQVLALDKPQAPLTRPNSGPTVIASVLRNIFEKHA